MLVGEKTRAEGPGRGREGPCLVALGCRVIVSSFEASLILVEG